MHTFKLKENGIIKWGICLYVNVSFNPLFDECDDY